MTLPLPPVVEQRIREAVRAHQQGHVVTFSIEHGGSGVKLMAIYRSARHVIFTSGTAGDQFAAMRERVLALYSEQKEVRR